MTQIESTIDQQEINKFAQHAHQWWDKNGPLKTLHDINSTRLEFISQQIQWDGLSVLDVGCGGGILSESMAEAGALVTGIDAASEAIDEAEQHAQHKALEIHYFCSPIEDFERGSFDAITCMELLEHVPNPCLILEHCQRLLKPDGWLFLSTVNRTLKAYAGAVFVAEYLLGILPRQTHDYKKFIKPGELNTMACHFGFELVKMQGLRYNPFSRHAQLCEDVSVNYLMAFKRTGS